MTDELDQKIRRLVAEAVESAPPTIDAPGALDNEPPAGRDRRPMLVGLAAVLMLFAIGGAVFVSSGEPTQQPVAVFDAVPAEEMLRLPSVLDRPRTPADELPPGLGLTSAQSPDGDIELDLDDSRLGIEAHGITVWVVPSLDRQAVCWSGSRESSFVGASSCTHLAFEHVVGADWVSVDLNGEGFSFGVILADDVVGIVGGTLVDDVFVHPSEHEPTFELRDGTTFTRYKSSEVTLVVPDDGTDDSPPESIEDSFQSVRAFCSEMAKLNGEKSESYIGSAQHIADFEPLVAVAPPDIAADVDLYLGYLESGVVDASVDPSSVDFENWPEEIQAAIRRLQSFDAENCTLERDMRDLTMTYEAQIADIEARIEALGTQEGPEFIALLQELQTAKASLNALTGQGLSVSGGASFGPAEE